MVRNINLVVVVLVAGLGSVVIAEDALTVAPNGNVGVGTTAPKAKLFVANGEACVDYGTGGSNGGGALRLASNTNQAFIGANQYWGGGTTKYARSGGSGVLSFDISTSLDTGGDIALYTCGNGDANNDTTYIERLRIKRDGHVGIGTASPDTSYKLHVAGSALAQGGVFQDSDYRLKRNITPLSNALEKVMRLKPSQYNFMDTPNRTEEGFLAHELQAVIPAAVMGEKDAVDTKGNIVSQAVNYSAVIPALAGAIQELKAENDGVKTDNAKLKATVEAQAKLADELKAQNAKLAESVSALLKRIETLEAAQPAAK